MRPRPGNEAHPARNGNTRALRYTFPLSNRTSLRLGKDAPCGPPGNVLDFAMLP